MKQLQLEIGNSGFEIFGNPIAGQLCSAKLEDTKTLSDVFLLSRSSILFSSLREITFPVLSIPDH